MSLLRSISTASGLCVERHTLRKLNEEKKVEFLSSFLFYLEAALPRLKYVYTTLEIPLLTILAQMERRGVLLDSDLLTKQSLAIAKQLSKLAEHVYQLAGQRFKFNSPKQLQEIIYLYSKHHFPVLQKTPTG